MSSSKISYKWALVEKLPDTRQRDFFNRILDMERDQDVFSLNGRISHVWNSYGGSIVIEVEPSVFLQSMPIMTYEAGLNKLVYFQDSKSDPVVEPVSYEAADPVMDTSNDQVDSAPVKETELNFKTPWSYNFKKKVFSVKVQLDKISLDDALAKFMSEPRDDSFKSFKDLHVTFNAHPKFYYDFPKGSKTYGVSLKLKTPLE